MDTSALADHEANLSALASDDVESATPPEARSSPGTPQKHSPAEALQDSPSKFLVFSDAVQGVAPSSPLHSNGEPPCSEEMPFTVLARLYQMASVALLRRSEQWPRPVLRLQGSIGSTVLALALLRRSLSAFVPCLQRTRTRASPCSRAPSQRPSRNPPVGSSTVRSAPRCRCLPRPRRCQPTLPRHTTAARWL